MTVMLVANSGGIRRCDARCHDAAKPDCDCICGGRYHGKKSWSQDLWNAIREMNVLLPLTFDTRNFSIVHEVLLGKEQEGPA